MCVSLCASQKLRIRTEHTRGGAALLGMKFGGGGRGEREAWDVGAGFAF